MIRIYLYLLAGVTSALLGWNIGQFLLTDLINQFLFAPTTDTHIFPFPELIIFPCIAISLAVGMVINEIFISNPIRPKLCFRKLKIPIFIAVGVGILSGFISGGIAQIIFAPQIVINPQIVRTLSWLLIGISVGLTEGLTWRWESIEAGDPQRFRQRFKISIIGSIVASLGAAVLFELIRQAFPDFLNTVRGIEEPLGFAILGALLGFTFSVTNSPSYMVALRAGRGFEYTGPTYEDIDPSATIISRPYPCIKKPILKFVSNSQEEKIEEGLSIQLPSKGHFLIGSGQGAHIFIPHIPLHVATLELKSRQAILEPNQMFFNKIEVNGNRLGTNTPVTLKHGDLLTFYTQQKEDFDEEKIYRFVYYNRFLDPGA